MTDDWKKALIVNKDREARPLLSNAMMALRRVPAWSGVLAYDEFARETVLAAAPPWASTPAWIGRPWTDHDDLLATDWLQQQGIGIPASVTKQAVEAVARDASYHPVIRYLEGLEHDGVPRLTMWLTDYMGTPSTPYSNAVARIALIAAIARIMRPGCKNDLVLILEGVQGALKSTAMRALFGPWFSDEIADFGSKDAAMQTRGVWGIEVGELDAMSRSEVSRIKAFVSRTNDRFRPPYGSRIIDSPRSCVFWGSTNKTDYLKDETGNRRFLPVRTGKIDINRLRADRDQLWAEALAAYGAGEKWWMTDAALLAAAEKEQQARLAEDPWHNLIERYVATRNSVTVSDVLAEAINMDKSRWTQLELNRVARCLTVLGWERKQRRIDGERTWIYVRSVTSSTSLQPEMIWGVTSLERDKM